MSHVAEVYENKETGERATIGYDDWPESPREWDNLGKFYAVKHRRYRLGDEQVDGADELQDICDVAAQEANLVFSVWMYEHGQVAFTLQKGFDRPHGLCPWDGGFAGLMVVGYEDQRPFDFDADRVFKCVEGELQTYEDYINGHVFYVTYEKSNDGDYEMVESCGGIYGFEYTREVIKELSGFSPYEVPGNGWELTHEN